MLQNIKINTYPRAEKTASMCRISAVVIELEKLNNSTTHFECVPSFSPTTVIAPTFTILNAESCLIKKSKSIYQPFRIMTSIIQRPYH